MTGPGYSDVELLRGDIHHLVSPIIGAMRLRLAHPDDEPLDLDHCVDRLYLVMNLMDEAATGVQAPGDQRQRHGVGRNHYPSLADPNSSPCSHKKEDPARPKP